MRKHRSYLAPLVRSEAMVFLLEESHTRQLYQVYFMTDHDEVLLSLNIHWKEWFSFTCRAHSRLPFRAMTQPIKQGKPPKVPDLALGGSGMRGKQA